MNLFKILATAAIALFSFTNVSAQGKSVHSTTVSKNNEIMNIAPGTTYAAKFGDLIEVTTYKPLQTQFKKYPAGATYNIFMVSQGPKRSPQSLFYFSTDKAYWQNALRSAGSFKINGLGAEGLQNIFQVGDKYTIMAVQYKENGPIELDFIFTRNGKKVGVIFADTKPMKWPGN